VTKKGYGASGELRQIPARPKKPEVKKIEPDIRQRDKKTEDERPDANSPRGQEEYLSRQREGFVRDG